MDKHDIIVCKKSKTYTYYISHYPGDWKNATFLLASTTKTITREEFLELAYHEDVEISVVDGEYPHPMGNGTVQRIRKPYSFEKL